MAGGGGGVGGTVHTIFLLPFLFGNAFCGFFRNEAEHTLSPPSSSFICGGERRGDLPVPSQSRARARVGPLRGTSALLFCSVQNSTSVE